MNFKGPFPTQMILCSHKIEEWKKKDFKSPRLGVLQYGPKILEKEKEICGSTNFKDP